MKKGLVLDRVVLLGRTFEEYCHCFNLSPDALRDRSILDVAAGVSSFTSEAIDRGLDVTALDVIYRLSPGNIRQRCEPDLDRVVEAISRAQVYRWDFYKSPERMRRYREKAYRRFLNDFAAPGPKPYIAGVLPNLPFSAAAFELTLVSYLLFVYEDQLDYEFHKQSLIEIMRVTSGEARFYPIVTFEAEPSEHLRRLKSEPELIEQFEFIEEQTGFEFLRGSNRVLRVRRRGGQTRDSY